MTVSASVSQDPASPPSGTVPDRLLDAALVCFRRLGSKRTRIEDIAVEAGVARTAVYRYFPNKRAILAALAARWLAEDETRLAAIARDGRRSPSERLEAFLLADAEAARRYLTDTALVEVLDEVARNIAPVTQQHRAHVRRHLAGLLAEGISAGAFPNAPADRLAQSLDDLMARFHDPRLAADLDADSWRGRAEAVTEIVLQAVNV